MSDRKRIQLTMLLIWILAVCAALGVWMCFRIAEENRKGVWPFQTGEYEEAGADLEITVEKASCQADIEIKRLVPREIRKKGFHFYDEELQQRLGAALTALAEKEGASYTMEQPMAVLNPFGTAANGLLLHFYTDRSVKIRYTIQVDKEDVPDFEATAANPYKEFSKKHVFQMIGLVPGEENHVVMEAVDRLGRVKETVEFTIVLPGPSSKYPTSLSYTEGQGQNTLTKGLYCLLRTAGYSNYAFFYDNSGIMRYEMRFERQGPVNVLWYEGDMLVNTSPYKIVRISPFGQVTRVYELGGLKIHHDMTVIKENRLLVLVSDENLLDLEDLIVELNLDTGEYEILMDFKEILPQYHSMTNIAGANNKTVRAKGKRDWLHLNSVYYEEATDSVILSARETSTIMKISAIHDTPKTEYFIGDPDFWKDTAYAELCYEPVGDFVYQYGQHSVEYAGNEGLEEGQYYLRLYNNNFWNLGTRNGYQPNLPDSVGTEIKDEPDPSWIYTYLVDEKEGTFALADSFPVPYSGLSSNVLTVGENYVINSATSKVFGEYDKSGSLIREFTYKTKTQAYRVYKVTGEGYWFVEESVLLEK